jgi:hypothetical protein
MSDYANRDSHFFSWQPLLSIGDYVERGFHLLHTFSHLVCLKLEFPGRIRLRRWNHESGGI